MATCWADRHPPESINPFQLRIPGGDRPVHPGGPGTREMAGFAVAEFGVRLGLSIGGTECFIADALDLRHRLPVIWGRVRRTEIEGFHAQLIARETRAEAADLIWFDAMLDRIADILGRRGDYRKKSARRAAALGVLDNPLQAIRLIAEDDAPSLFDPDLDDESLLPVPREPEPGEPTVDDPASAGPRGDGADVARPDPDPTPGGDSARQRCEDSGDPTSAEAEAADASSTKSDATPTGQAGDSAPAPGDTPGPHDIEPIADPVTPPFGDPTAFTRITPPVRWPRIDQDQRMSEAAIRAISELDPARFLPRATLYVHIALETLQAGLGVTRVEDLGPIISSQVANWLQECQVTVKPVIDLNAEQIPIDSYEVPKVMRERVFLRHPGSMFPYSASVGRPLDLDHAIPYREGIAGQTGDDKSQPGSPTRTPPGHPWLMEQTNARARNTGVPGATWQCDHGRPDRQPRLR